ncbi:MAG: protein kinase [Gemmataceae bacterium]
MVAPSTSEEFLDLVRKSGVIDPARVDSFASTLKPQAAPQAIAQRMVGDGLLTEFQARQLLQGKHRRFILSGKYKLLELIGAGGMGAVYLCEHIYMSRLVALKVLPSNKLEDRATLERFYREAKAVGQLDHPNIVRAHDIDRDDNILFLVLEYIDGSSLQEIVGRYGPMDFIRAAHYIAQAALGLEHAHAANLIHRDIKPGNLLLDRGGTIKILDLGLARFFNAPPHDNVTAKYDEGTILGTADYLAPEQGLPGAIDIRADIYSLGSTLYFLLTGKAPFEDGTLSQKMLWHQTRAPRAVTEYRSDVPAPLLAVLDRMMAKDPSTRYQSPREVVVALQPWTCQPIALPPAREMPKRSRASKVAGAQGTVAVPVPPPRSSRVELPGRLTIRPPDPADTPAISVSETAPIPRSKPEPAIRPLPVAPVPPSRVSWKPVVAAATAVVVVGVATWALRPRRTEPQVPAATDSTAAKVPVLPGESRIETAAIVDADRAREFDGKRRTVRMVVSNVDSDSSNAVFFLNTERDHASPSNFVLVVTKELLPALRVDGRSGLEDRYKNRVIQATGVIRRNQDHFEILLESATDLVRPDDNTP